MKKSSAEKHSSHKIPTVLIDNEDHLSAVVSELKNSRLLALDTEFDNMWTRFGMNLELIQIFDGEKVYLIRTCFIKDIAILDTIMGDANIVKAIYSAGEDIRALKSRGLFLKGLYDLQVAAKLAEVEAISFIQLVKELIGVEVGKDEQRSDWRARTLSDAQITYAKNDVVYSLQLYTQLKDKVQAAGKEEILEEKNKATEEVVSRSFKVKLKPIHRMQDKVTRRRIQRLLEFRVQLAKKKDVPPIRVFSDELIDEIWKAGTTFESLSLLKGCPRPYKGSSPEANWINQQIKNILRG